jgi:hypothetical protein
MASVLPSCDNWIMPTFRASLIAAFWLLLSIAACAEDASPLVNVCLRMDAGVQTIQGRVLVEAVDGGLLVETRDGVLVTIKPGDLIERSDAGEPFTDFTSEELGRALLNDLGDGFEIVRTRRYVIATNAGRPYAEWCGRLFERLHTAFLLHWKRAGLELQEPAAPLPAIVFATPEQFAAYATGDAGPQVAQVKGYYSVRTNRIILADLTRSAGQADARTDAEIERRLATSLLNVATVVHEATHQIAFNCGLQTRYADNPMWVSEGLAMFFEAPDLGSTTGWRTIGKVHPQRLARFQQFARGERPAASLPSLLVNEDRFRDPATSSDAYSESWALTYFLVRNRKEAFVGYLRKLSAKPRLVWNDADTRLKDFEAAFGPVADLEEEFLKYTARLRSSQ